jgi:hypothetical protein
VDFEMNYSLATLKQQLDGLPPSGELGLLYSAVADLFSPGSPKQNVLKMIKVFARSCHCTIRLTTQEQEQVVEFTKNAESIKSQTKPRKNNYTSDDPAQSQRFLDTAKEVGADTDDEALERAFKKIVPAKKPATKSRP